MLLTKIGSRPDYPEKRRFAICLTHDVDCIYCGKGRDRAFSKIVEMLPRGVISTTRKMLEGDIGRLNWRNMKKIMEIEESYGAQSTFFFMALEKGQRDSDYGISEVAEELHDIVDMGWGVGLHGSHEA
jgi:peptidoglycan/xylan/chitin deacetylase (PgdA/CDA1 family)